MHETCNTWKENLTAFAGIVKNIHAFILPSQVFAIIFLSFSPFRVVIVYKFPSFHYTFIIIINQIHKKSGRQNIFEIAKLM